MSEEQIDILMKKMDSDEAAEEMSSLFLKLERLILKIVPYQRKAESHDG
jgi:hypothetical protein